MDPDPHPYVFVPPGSGSVCQITDPDPDPDPVLDPSIIKQKEGTVGTGILYIFVVV